MPRHTGGFITEAEVATALGTSRTPVREALLRLETEGFLQILPKKGAYVPPISDAEAEAVMQARGMVEDWCVRRAPANSAGLARVLGDLIKEQEGLLADPVAFIECDRRFHRTVVEASGNPVIAQFYETLRDKQVRMGLQAVMAAEDRARLVLSEHAAIVEALRNESPDAAADAVARHLQSTREILMTTSVTAPWSSHFSR